MTHLQRQPFDHNFVVVRTSINYLEAITKEKKKRRKVAMVM